MHLKEKQYYLLVLDSHMVQQIFVEKNSKPELDCVIA